MGLLILFVIYFNTNKNSKAVTRRQQTSMVLLFSVMSIVSHFVNMSFKKYNSHPAFNNFTLHERESEN